MSTGALDPLIHNPERLRIVATLAALPDGDALSVTRLQDMIGLTPGSLIAGLRELDDAGYVRTGKTGGGTALAAVALTRDGRAALDRYTAVLRQLPPVARRDAQPPAPGVRAGDADRDAAAAALGEHFAQGRLTLDELNARLDVTLTAATHGELSLVAQDLPDLTVFPARVSFPRGKRARPGHKPVRNSTPADQVTRLPAGAARPELDPGHDGDGRQQQPGGEQDVDGEAEDHQGHEGGDGQDDDGEHGGWSP
jgi:DNA-binding transcriptional ArsR family regulator